MLDINKFGVIIRDLNASALASGNPVWFVEKEDLEDYAFVDIKRLWSDVRIINMFYPRVIEHNSDDCYLVAFTNFLFVFNSKQDLIDCGWADAYKEKYGESMSKAYDRDELYAEIVHNRLNEMWKGE